MSYIFISYAHEDLVLANRIVESLARYAVDTWINWKDIPKGEDWVQEIYRSIEEADAVLFLISPDSVASEMCNKEIAHAVGNGKRILPILVRTTDENGIHPEISKRNWVFCLEGQDDFDRAVEEIYRSISVNYEWLKYHTELQTKALRWVQKKDDSWLLRGRELRDADHMFSNFKPGTEPSPTDIQYEYLQTSREFEQLLRRRVFVSIAAGGILVMILVWFGMFQARTASENNQTAVAEMILRSTAESHATTQSRLQFSQQLAAISLDKIHTNPDLSILLSVEAFRQGDTYQARKSLASLMKYTRCVDRYFYLEDAGVIDVQLTADGSRLLASNSNGNVFVWNLADSSEVIVPAGSNNPQMDISYDNSFMVVSQGNGKVSIRDIDTLQVVGEIQSGLEIYDLKLGNASHILAIAGTPPIIELWDPSRYKPITTLIESRNGFYHENVVVELAFDPKDRFLAASGGFGGNGLILVWDLGTVSPDASPISPPDDMYHPIAFNSIPSFFAYGNARRVFIHGVGSTHPPLSAEAASQISSLVFKPSGTSLISGHIDGTIRWWNLSGKYEGTPPYLEDEYTGHGSNTAVTQLDILDDSQLLVSGDNAGRVILWRPNYCTPEANSKLVDRKKLWPDSIGIPKGDVAYHALNVNTGTLAISPYGSGDLLLYDLEEGSQTGSLDGLPDQNGPVALSPSGEFLASVESHSEIWIWDLTSTDQPVKVIDISGYPNLTALTINSNGNILTLGTNEGKILLYDIYEDRFIADPLQHSTREITQLAFSPDGRMLASLDYYKKIIIWDTTVYMPVTEFFLDYYVIGPFVDFSFSPDSNTLRIHHLSSPVSNNLNDDEWNIDWIVSPDLWIEVLCNRVGRNPGITEWEQYFPGESYHPVCPQWVERQ